MNLKAFFTGQRAGLLGVALMACVSQSSASDYQIREAYFKANTGRALEVLLDSSLARSSSFEWRGSKIDSAYVRTLAALKFGMSVADSRSESAGRVRLALAENQLSAGDYPAALATLQGGGYSKGLERAQSQYLRGQIFIHSNEIDQAQRLFKKWKGKDPLQAYLGLNIGIWFAEQNQLNKSAQWLAKTAAMQLPEAEEWNSLTDRANVYLGGVYNFLGKPDLARKALEKVRLSGVDANRALLSLGWTDVARSQNKQALAPWSYLSEQSHSDASVQESYLLVPFALGKLEAHGKASNVYAKAIRIYDQELALLGKVKKQAADGSLLKRITRVHQSSKATWQSSIRRAAGPQLTAYLTEALKQEELYMLMKSYMEIEDMRRWVTQVSGSTAGAKSALLKMQSVQQAYAKSINQVLQQDMAAQIKRLKEYQSHANFSLAESYERVADSNAWEQ